MPGLQSVGDEGARCVFCGRLAAGPCASCGRPVCGDCCTLTEGGVKVWAICVACERRGGRSLGSVWGGLLGWLGLVLVVIVVVAVVVVFAAGRR